jgi:hypothetical protein
MIDNAVLKRLLLVAAALLVISTGAGLALGIPLSFLGGMLVGYVLGALPVASWAWVAPRLLLGQSRALAVALLFLKVGVYAGALYVCVYRHLVPPFSILIGMLVVGSVLVVGLLLRTPAPAKEAA